MEFGTSSRVDAGANVVGLSWTSPTAASESNWLVTTTESRVSVHAAEDARLVNSWLTRPGSYNRFTVAAIQNRVSRRFYCVQNGNRLFSWSERDTSLDTATRKKLPGDVYALRTSHKLPVIIAVLTDGSICVQNDKLEEVVSVPAVRDGTVVTWTRFARVPGDDSRFVLLTLRQRPALAPGPAPAAPAPASAKKGKAEDAAAAAAQQPYMCVYTVVRTAGTPSAGAAGGDTAGAPPPPLSLQVKHVATRQLVPPAEALALAAGPDGPAVRVTSITLHKLLNALSVLWSTGHLQTLQFGHSAHWYTSTPRQTVLRHLGRFLPHHASSGGAPREDVSAAGGFQGASFALEPSCLVLAGCAPPASGSSGGGDVGLSVWDVRYGILLAVKHVRPGGDDADGSTPPIDSVPAEDDRMTASSSGETPGGSGSASKARHRSNSSASAAASSSVVGSMLSATQAVSSQALTPDSVFQVTVSEDNAYVALASRRRVIITAVAARGASLVSAINRMQTTRLLLADDSVAPGTIAIASPAVRAASEGGGGSALRYEHLAPVLSLTDCLRLSGISQPMGDGTSVADTDLAAVAAGRKAWAGAVATATQATQRCCEAVLDPQRTPTAEAVLAVLTEASGSAKGGAAGGSAAAAAAAPEGPAGSKRKRKGTQDATAAPAAAATPAADASSALSLPRSVALCALQRCVTELSGHGRRAEAAAAGAGGLPPLAVAPVLRELLALRAVSLASSPALLPALMAAAAATRGRAVPGGAASGGRSARRGRTASVGEGRAGSAKAAASPATTPACDDVTALQLVCEVLAVCTDTPEAALVDIFVRLLNSISGSTLSGLWERCSSSKTATGTEGAGSGLEPAQRALLHVVSLLVGAPRNDVFLEQALRGLSTDSVTVLLAALNRLLAGSLGGAPSSLRAGQVLDWMRMLLDAHFARLAILIRAPGGEALHAVLKDVVAAVTAQVADCEAAAPLRGGLQHLLMRCALPRPPQPDHVVEEVLL